jgi:hypothetical protein
LQRRLDNSILNRDDLETGNSTNQTHIETKYHTQKKAVIKLAIDHRKPLTVDQNYSDDLTKSPRLSEEFTREKFTTPRDKMQIGAGLFQKPKIGEGAFSKKL